MRRETSVRPVEEVRGFASLLFRSVCGSSVISTASPPVCNRIATHFHVALGPYTPRAGAMQETQCQSSFLLCWGLLRGLSPAEA